MLRDDQVYLRHMLDAAREARAFVGTRGRADLDTERMLVLSLVKCVEIIGEAASRVSPEYREAHAEIPWRDIIAMRNRLIHAYFDINLDIVWSTVTEELPPLIADLERML